MRPAFIDTILCALPVVFIAVYLPLMILLDHHYTEAIRSVRTMLSLLQAQSDSWTGGKVDMSVAAQGKFYRD